MNRLLIVIIFQFLVSCATVSEGPPYIKKIPPLTQVPGLGVSFTIPDEEGWMLFDPDGKGSTIVKVGRTKIESYVISLDSFQLPDSDTSYDFRKLYEASKKGEITPPRYSSLVIKDEANKSESEISFYYLVEDHQPIKIRAGDEHMLLETMGVFAKHPKIPNNIVRIAYSYRYAIGNEDPEFKKKAKWVLDQITFTNQ